MTKQEPGESSHQRAASNKIATRALVTLAVCAVLSILYVFHSVFIPVALALLFATILSSTVEAWYRHRLPRSLSAVLLLAILMSVLGGLVYTLSIPAQAWIASLPQTLQVIERKVRPAKVIMGRIETLTTRAGSLAEVAPARPASAAPVVTAAPPPVTTGWLLEKARAGMVSTVTVVILTLFLLSGGPPMLARMAAALATDLDAVHALKVIGAIRHDLGRYYGTIALINLGLGICTGTAMMLLGVPTPFLWGTMAGVLNFVPYVGSAVTLLVLSFVAVVSFDNIGHIAAVSAIFLALATIEGQVVQPLFVGQRLEINPLVVFLAVWFAGWMWGIAGIAIAVPGLVALKVAAEHTRGSKALLEFLSPANTKRLKLRR